MPVTNRILLGICAVDYLGNPYQNADTPGLIVDDVSGLEQQRVCCNLFFPSDHARDHGQISSSAMSLDCYFRRENNQQCDIKYEYADNVSTLAVVPFRDYLRFVFLQYL